MEQSGSRSITGQEKRIIVQRFAHFQQFSRPGTKGNTFARIPEEPRCEAVCVPDCTRILLPPAVPTCGHDILPRFCRHMPCPLVDTGFYPDKAGTCRALLWTQCVDSFDHLKNFKRNVITEKHATHEMDISGWHDLLYHFL